VSRVSAFAPKIDPFWNPNRLHEQARAKDLKAALDALRKYGELYAVELAGFLGLRYSKAKSILRTLEGQGKVESRLDRSPVSGLGRRYYRAKR